MNAIHIVPNWFYDFGVAFNLIFLVISCSVALYSYKVYKLSSKNEIKYFSIGFSLISLAYLSKVLLFLTTFVSINEKYVGIIVEKLNTTGLFLTYSHLTLFIIGITTILYATLKTESFRIYILLILLSLISIFLTSNKIKSFLSISALYLLFISYHYGKEYIKFKNFKTALIFIGFVLLFISKLEVSISSFYLSFLIEQAIELVAYLFIACSLVLVFRKGNKK